MVPKHYVNIVTYSTAQNIVICEENKNTENRRQYSQLGKRGKDGEM